MRKYTKERLQEAASKSQSIYGVLRCLGASESSGAVHTLIKERIKEYNIDISHFKGIRANSGEHHVGGYVKLKPDDILTLRSDGRRHKTFLLRRMMLEIGKKEICSVCNLGTLWNNKHLVMQIEHKNGNCLDNRPENLDFICPNCHTQTSTYSRRKTRRQPRFCNKCGTPIFRWSKSGYCYKCSPKQIALKRNKCLVCGLPISNRKKYCSYGCSHKGHEKIKWPENLIELCMKTSKRAVADMLGVSDKAVAKRSLLKRV